MPEIIVIGSGIGGLLAAARLSRDFDVAVYERLPITGGRFTNIRYKGFELSTGALHMIPHGATGPLGCALKEVGARVDIVKSEPDVVVLQRDGSSVLFRQIPKALGMTRIEVLTYLAKVAASRKRKNLTETFGPNPVLAQVLDAFCGWALSLRLSDLPASELLGIYRNIKKYGTPGVPIGGCKAVVDSLLEVIDGQVYANAEVSKIVADGNVVKGIEVNGQTVKADYLISDIGPDATSALLGISTASETPTSGIKICMCSAHPLIDHTGVLLTPFAQRVKGLNEVTNADPNLAPPGKHLIMSHQPLLSGDLEHEIRVGVRDLRAMFGDSFDVLVAQSYYGKWPVNRVALGSESRNATAYRNLYLVGDGAKGKGGIEVEGVALGVEAVVSTILN